MIRLFAIGLCALFMSLSGHASAQVSYLPQAQQQMAVQNASAVLSAGQQISAILTPVMSDPGLLSARSQEQFVAALVRLLPQIAEGRRQLATIRTQLGDLPRLGEPGGPLALIGVDRAVANMIELTRLADGILADHEALADAIEKRDQQAIEAVSRSLLRGPILLLEANAVSMRGQLSLVGSDTSEYAVMEGMACFYDGLAAFYGGIYGASARSDAAATMKEARTCMIKQIENGRANLAREARNVPEDATGRRMFQQATSVIDEMFDYQVTGADLLAEAHASLLEGWSMDQLIQAYDTRAIEFQLGFSGLQQRIVRINQTQGR